MKSPLIAAWLPAVALLAACDQTATPTRPSVDTAKIVDTIKTDEVHANADWKSGNADKVASFFAPDAAIMVAGAPPAVGAAAIKATAQQLMNDPAFTLTFVSDRIDVAASGDLAVAHGTYKQTTTDPKTRAVVTETGSYVTVFKPRSDGAWKGTWDIVAPGPAASVGATMAGATTAKAPQ